MEFLLLCILLQFDIGIIIAKSKTLGVQYRGCLLQAGANAHDPSNAVNRGPFKYKQYIATKSSIHSCVYACFASRYKMAAMQTGFKCFCASNSRGMIRLPDDFCYERCHGNCRQRCGGMVTLSVYNTGYAEEPRLTFSPESLKNGLIGCYLKKQAIGQVCVPDSRLKTDLTSPRMTPQLCVIYCGSGTGIYRKTVAALTSTDTCCCGNYLDKARHAPGKRDIGYCSKPCVGVKTSLCAGQSYNNKEQMENFITVYDVVAIHKHGIPYERNEIFDRKKVTWMYPMFPPDEELELKDGILQAKLDARRTGTPILVDVDNVAVVRKTNVSLHKRDAKQTHSPNTIRIAVSKKSVSERDAKHKNNTTVNESMEVMPELIGQIYFHDNRKLKKHHEAAIYGFQPIVDADNTGVRVVDDMVHDDAKESSIGEIVLLAAEGVLILSAFCIILYKKKDVIINATITKRITDKSRKMKITSDEVVHLSEPNSESECNENGASDIVDSKLENTDKELLDPLLKPS